MRGGGEPQSAPTATPRPVETATPPPPAPAPVREPTPAPQPSRARPRQTAPAVTPSSLTVTEFGLGDRLETAGAAGEGATFPRGARVVFATRVVGGRAGERIRHVWLRDGRIEQSIRLRLGGTSWRTHSTKTLGRGGAWAVEARDAGGRVLQRMEFRVAG
jgi:hypothetical protein